MAKTMSLRLRLNLLITALLLVFMLAAGWVMVGDMRASTRERVEAAVRVTIQLLDTVIISSVQNPEWGYTHEVLKGFLQSLGYVRSSQIVLYDYRGNLIYQSPPSIYLSNVQPPEWFIELVRPKAEEVRRRIRYGMLVVTSSPDGAIREAWSGARQLIWIALGFFFVLNGMVYWMLGRWLRPVGDILGAINRMEQGDLAARLPEFRQPEFGRIAHSLNRMAESLGAERELEENRQLTHLIQRHIEDERRSLSRELHDELGQYVTAIKTFAVGIANKTRTKMPDVEANAQTIVAAANHIYDSMHNIIRQLRPGSLDNLGLSETLRDAVSTWQAQNPEVRFGLNLSADFNAQDAENFGETLNINLYRIVQESVTNALRHAKASTIDIALALNGAGELQLTIKDNGAGMIMCNVDQTKHFGLLGMRERAQALQGSFNVDSIPEEGTLVTVTIPNPNKTEGKA
jgi:two-component system sensor histidine kinase UhpB